MLWGDYLRMLAEDGVQLGTSEEEALAEDGRRIIAHFLERDIEGRKLYYVMRDEVREDERVPWYVQRQVVNTLRLPPEKYIFPSR